MAPLDLVLLKARDVLRLNNTAKRCGLSTLVNPCTLEYRKKTKKTTPALVLYGVIYALRGRRMGGDIMKGMMCQGLPRSAILS